MQCLKHSDRSCHSGKITSRVQYMVEVMFAIRKDKFKVRMEHHRFLHD